MRGGEGLGRGSELPNDMLPAFDYGSLNEDHKKAASEIARLLEDNGNEMIAELIKSKFQLTEPVRKKPEESIFVRACLENNIHCSIQGWVAHGIGPDAVHYPLISISEDVRVLDKLVTFIRNI